jgi:hypothetical protein
MAEKIKFHLDENVRNAIAEGLRRRGIDLTTTPEQSLNCSQGNKSIGEIIRGLILIWELLEPSDMFGKVEFL